MGDARPGRRVVISGDTAPCKETAAASKGADLLVHDGSFAVEEADRAAETGHTTARDAAILARGGSGCSPSSTCRPATTSPSCLPRRARSTRPRSRRATSTSSRSPFLSAAISSTRPSSAASPGGRLERARPLGLASRKRGDRPGQRRRLVLLEEVLRREQDRVVDTEHALDGEAAVLTSAGSSAPHTTWAGNRGLRERGLPTASAASPR